MSDLIADLSNVVSDYLTEVGTNEETMNFSINQLASVLISVLELTGKMQKLDREQMIYRINSYFNSLKSVASQGIQNKGE